MKNGKSFIGYVILTLLVAAFSYGPIEQIFYRSPDLLELNTIVGTLEFKRGWKGGERIFIRNELGKTLLTCRISSAWLQADCPISKKEKEILAGKQVAIRWHEQSRWPLTTSEKQIYEIYVPNDNKIALNRNFMVNHYKKQKSMFGSLITLAFITFIVIAIVVTQRHQEN